MVPRQNKDRGLVLYFIDKKKNEIYSSLYMGEIFLILNIFVEDGI